MYTASIQKKQSVRRMHDSHVISDPMRTLAETLIDRLDAEGLWYETKVFTHNKTLLSELPSNSNGLPRRMTHGNTVYYELDGPASAIDKHCNDDAVSIISDGPLYDLLNKSDYLEKLDDYLEPYNLYFDRISPHCISAYEQ